MQHLIFDFERIGSLKDFYAMAKRQLQLPEHFGNNLDALWDVLNGDINLPVSIEFVHLSLAQLETFAEVIDLFEEAAAALAPDLTFIYSLKK